MAASSLMVPLGTQAPDFTLPDTTGTMTRRDDFTAAPAGCSSVIYPMTSLRPR
jgi:peroxiredoxin